MAEPNGREIAVMDEAEAMDTPTPHVPARRVSSNGAALAARREVAGLMKPVAPANEVLEAQNETRELIAKALQKDRDFGVIPGTDKPALLKPGAERIIAAFGCAGQPEIVEQEVDHDRVVEWNKTKWVKVDPPAREECDRMKAEGTGRWRKYGDDWVWQEKQEERGTSLGLYRYVVRFNVVHRASGVVIGSGLGSCSTLESKYIDRPRDSENTALKMAKKRAQIDAVLSTFGLSDQFTQDVEENADAHATTADPSISPNGEKPEDRPPVTTKDPTCPVCDGQMWNNLERKAKGQMKKTAPDYKCRKKDCDGCFWPGEWPGESPEPPVDEVVPSGGAQPALAVDAQVQKIKELRQQIAGMGGNAEALDPVVRAAADGALTAVRAANAIAKAEQWIAQQVEAKIAAGDDGDLPF